MARRTISFYATVKTYMPLWELHGFADNAVAAGDAFRRGDLAAVPAAISDEMVDTYCAAGPLDKVRARVEATAERADGLFLTPPTYFISPEELSEYQNRLIDAFGPGGLTRCGGDPASTKCWSGCGRSRRASSAPTATSRRARRASPASVLFEADEPDLPWWRVVRADGSLAKGAASAGSSPPRASRSAASGSRWPGAGSGLVRPPARPAGATRSRGRRRRSPARGRGPAGAARSSSRAGRRGRCRTGTSRGFSYHSAPSGIAAGPRDQHVEATPAGRPPPRPHGRGPAA